MSDAPQTMPRLFPGQPDADADRWFAVNYPAGLTDMSYRHYATELYKTRPSKDADDDGFYRWNDSLSEHQRELLSKARAAKNADPKVKAARKKARASDPYYQKQLEHKREVYRAEIKDDEGREVRGYRRGAKLSPADKSAERKARNDKARAFIRDEFEAERNPYAEEERSSNLRKRLSFLICEILLKRGAINVSEPKVIEEALAFLPEGTAAEEVEKELKGIIETLRVAKAITIKGPVLTLRAYAARIEAARLAKEAEDEAAMRALPYYGMM